VKNFADLTEREVLAVAISSEEEDSRIYMTFAEDLAERYPDSAKIFVEMAEEERGHRHMLLELYESALARICRRSAARTSRAS
jgi:rubrerythrin